MRTSGGRKGAVGSLVRFLVVRVLKAGRPHAQGAPCQALGVSGLTKPAAVLCTSLF